jgi:hypothetical protein
MGYESIFYVVEKTDLSFKNEKGLKIEDLACFDIHKMHNIEWLSKFPKTDCFIFTDNGNTKIVKDYYGDPLIEIPINDLIKIIENNEKLKEHRRTTPFLALLKGFNQSEFPHGLIVLHYGIEGIDQNANKST